MDPFASAMYGLQSGMALAADRRKRKQLKKAEADQETIRSGYKSGGLMGASMASAGVGRPDIALAYQNVHQGKRAFQMAAEDRARKHRNMDSIGKAFADGGPRAAAEMAGSLGMSAESAAFESIFQAKGGYDSLKATSDQADFGRQFLAITGGTPEGVLENLPALNRMIQTNPELWQKIAMLGDKRIPTGVYASEDPDGNILLGLDVYNQHTKSIGPATQRGTASEDDTVMAVKPEVMVNLAKAWVSGQNPNATKGSGQWDYKDGMLFNKATGQYLSPNANNTDFIEVLGDLAADASDTGAAITFDQHQKGQFISTFMTAGLDARSFGMSTEESVNFANSVMELALTDDRFTSIILPGERGNVSAEDRERTKLEIYRHLAPELFTEMPGGGDNQAPTEAANDGLVNQGAAPDSMPIDENFPADIVEDPEADDAGMDVHKGLMGISSNDSILEQTRQRRVAAFQPNRRRVGTVDGSGITRTDLPPSRIVDGTVYPPAQTGLPPSDPRIDIESTGLPAAATGQEDPRLNINPGSLPAATGGDDVVEFVSTQLNDVLPNHVVKIRNYLDEVMAGNSEIGQALRSTDEAERRAGIQMFFEQVIGMTSAHAERLSQQYGT